MIPCLAGQRAPYAREALPITFGSLYRLTGEERDRLRIDPGDAAPPARPSFFRRCLGCCVAPPPERGLGATALRRAVLVGVRERLEEEYGREGIEPMLARVHRARADEVRRLLACTRPGAAGEVGGEEAASLVMSTGQMLRQHYDASQFLVGRPLLETLYPEELQRFAYSHVNDRMNADLAAGRFPEHMVLPNVTLRELRPAYRAALLRASRERVQRLAVNGGEISPRALHAAIDQAFQEVLNTPPPEGKHK